MASLATSHSWAWSIKVSYTSPHRELILWWQHHVQCSGLIQVSLRLHSFLNNPLPLQKRKKLRDTNRNQFISTLPSCQLPTLTEASLQTCHITMSICMLKANEYLSCPSSAMTINEGKAWHLSKLPSVNLWLLVIYKWGKLDINEFNPQLTQLIFLKFSFPSMFVLMYLLFIYGISTTGQELYLVLWGYKGE